MEVFTAGVEPFAPVPVISFEAVRVLEAGGAAAAAAVRDNKYFTIAVLPLSHAMCKALFP